jgi:hypothetical protein
VPSLIYESPDKIYLGVEHGVEPKLSAAIVQRLKKVAAKHGAWYEGVGGDIGQMKKILGTQKSYKGSWDDEFAKSVKDYPSEYLYTLFTNVKENNQGSHLVNPRSSIFDSILGAQKNVGFFKDRNFDAETLRQFLEQASDSSTPLSRWSQQPANHANVEKFLKAGEEKMWPNNWQEYPYNAGKLAKKAEEARNKYLLNSGPGVYVTGSDHLKELQALSNKLKIVNAD